MSKEIKKIISIVMCFMLIFGTVVATQTIVSADDSNAPPEPTTSFADNTRPTSIRDIIPTTEETTTATTTKPAADDGDSILARLTTTTHNYGGVTTVWEDIGPAEPTGTDNVSSRVSIDGNTIYYVTFYANGYKIAKVPYVTSAKSIEEPPVPIIDGYVGRWESYELDGGDKSVNAIYMPASTAVYYVTFVADGETVSKVPFVYGMKEIKEPDVPEKRGYTGEWSDYSLIPCDITVNAVYTKKGNIFTNFFRSIIEFFRSLFDFSKTKIENPFKIGERSTTAQYWNQTRAVNTTSRMAKTTTTTKPYYNSPTAGTGIVDRYVGPEAEQALLGYKKSPEGYYYCDDKDNWQEGTGYNEVYDKWAPVAAMYIDQVRIRFRYENKNWMIQLWKGQYGYLLIGAEIGVYTCALDEYNGGVGDINHFNVADKEDWLYMQMDCYYCKGSNGEYKKIFTRPYDKYWWVTGFVKGQLTKYTAPRTELKTKNRITFKSKEQANLFAEALEISGFSKASSADNLGNDTYYVSGADVWVLWATLYNDSFVGYGS